MKTMNTRTRNGHTAVITHYNHRNTRFPLVGYIEANGVRKFMKWTTAGYPSRQCFNYDYNMQINGLSLESGATVSAAVQSQSLTIFNLPI